MKSKIVTGLSVIRTYGFFELFGLVRSKFRNGFKKEEFTSFSTNSLSIFDSFSALESNLKGLEISFYLSELSDRDRLDSESNKDNARGNFFSPIYDLGEITSVFLYSWIRVNKPKLVFETGVAAGKSSWMILDALKRNGSGKLTSVDITKNVGGLVPDDLKDNWDLLVMPKFRRKDHFVELVKENYSLNIFLHDSDHSLEWQEFELQSILKYARNFDLIIVDDVNVQSVNLIKSDLRNFEIFLIQEANKKALVAFNSN
jgi:hypothetical protein